MTILPAGPALLEVPSPLPPTHALPPISKIASASIQDLQDSLRYLNLLYSPEDDNALPSPHSLAALRADHFERAYSLRWLTALIARVDPTPDAEPLLLAAAALLALCAGASAAGALTRSFAFGAFSVVLSDAPLENADYSSVGAQTWGGACVLSEMLVEAPHQFGLSNSTANAPLRALELGAGTGLVSIALAKCALQQGYPLDLVASDFHPPVLANLRANIASNLPSEDPSVPVAVCTAFLDWSESASMPDGTALEPPFDTPFDLILGADIVYEVDHTRWIKASVERFLRRTSTARFHLVVALRSGFDAETESVERLFPTVEKVNRMGELVLAVARKEVIACEDGSLTRAGKDAEEVEYGHYTIQWAGSRCITDG